MSTVPSLPMKDYVTCPKERITHYVSDDELTELCEGSQNLWKDLFCLVLPTAIACLGNAAVHLVADLVQKPVSISLRPFINGVVGVSALVLTIVFGICWWRSHQSASALAAHIRERPRVAMDSSQVIVDVGELPTQRQEGERGVQLFASHTNTHRDIA